MISLSETNTQIRQSHSGEHQAMNGTAMPSMETLAQRAKRAPVPVTVVVCARNRGSVIGRCLDSVIRANPSEIIVVDGNSTDDTVAIARARNVTVLSDNGAGLGAARQLGASVAKNEYVIFVDTDVVVEPETLAQLLDEAREENYDALQAELRTLSVSPTYWQGAERWRREVQMRKGVAAVLGCQVTLVRKELLLTVGFDPAFKGAAEDADFCFRARAAGAVVAHSARALAYHEDRGTLRDFVEQKIWHGRGLARMIARYGRQYLSRAAEQVDTSVGATKINVQYLPYVFVSWSFTALGVALESVRIACDPALRQRLTTEQGV
jgi:glycosyltransferase involved in cell wall biosynthesis